MLARRAELCERGVLLFVRLTPRVPRGSKGVTALNLRHHHLCSHLVTFIVHMTYQPSKRFTTEMLAECPGGVFLVLLSYVYAHKFCIFMSSLVDV